jgi:class 3 adenylate cyclase
MGALTEKWRQLGHDVGFGIGIAHGYATLGTIGFEGRFDYAAIGTVSNVASRSRGSAQSMAETKRLRFHISDIADVSLLRYANV